MNNEEAVAEGARLFAAAEEALVALSNGLPAVINAVRDNGTIGALEAQNRIAATLAEVNSALGDVGDAHQELVDRCQELGIDLPAMRGGTR